MAMGHMCSAERLYWSLAVLFLSLGRRKSILTLRSLDFSKSSLHLDIERLLEVPSHRLGLSFGNNMGPKVISR